MYYHLYLTMGLGLDEDDDAKRQKTNPKDDPYFVKALNVRKIPYLNAAVCEILLDIHLTGRCIS